MNNKFHVLISPIGRSPGAVTGAYHALSHPEGKGIPITKVVTIGTKDVDTQASQDYVHDYFHALSEVEGLELRHISRRIEAVDLDEAAADQFLELFKTLLNEYNKDPNTVVHICITPGLSGMSGLAVLATNFYGADYIYHYWIDDIYSSTSHIRHDYLENDPEDSLENPRMNPYAIDPHANHALVPLNFISLGKLLPIIRTYIESDGQTYPDDKSVWYHLATLSQTEIQAFEMIPPKAVEALAKLADTPFAEMSSDEQKDLRIEMHEILLDYQITDRVLRDRIWEAIQTAATGEELTVSFSGKLDRPRSAIASQLVYDVFINVIANVIAGAGMQAAGLSSD